jgi:hypothetical protein
VRRESTPPSDPARCCAPEPGVQEPRRSVFMSDDDFLTEMAKDHNDAKHSKQIAKQTEQKTTGKQPGKPASQTTPKGPQDSGKRR